MPRIELRTRIRADKTKVLSESQKRAKRKNCPDLRTEAEKEIPKLKIDQFKVDDSKTDSTEN